MTLSTITTAAREYASRPADERFPSLTAMVDAATHQRNLSVEKDYNLKDLKVVVSTGKVGQEKPILQSPKGTAEFSHWAFGQFCRTLQAPAAYLRTLPADVAADALNYGISQTPAGQTARLLVQAPNGRPTPLIRAATSESYGRVWDSELYSMIDRALCQTDSRWTLPPTWDGVPAGAYRGDRDSFLILVNGGSIVKDPSLANAPQRAYSRNSSDISAASAGQDGMYRGLLVRNSEVGHAAITIESILFRYVCGNHMLWGAMVDTKFRRRHVGEKVVRDAAREIGQFARSFSDRPASADEAIIKHLIDHELAHTEAACIDELRKMGASQEDAKAAYKACVEHEAVSPRSFWGVAQGLTRISQAAGFQDERLQLDQLAGKIMAKGLARVRV